MRRGRLDEALMPSCPRGPGLAAGTSLVNDPHVARYLPDGRHCLDRAQAPARTERTAQAPRTPAAAGGQPGERPLP